MASSTTKDGDRSYSRPLVSTALLRWHQQPPSPPKAARQRQQNPPCTAFGWVQPVQEMLLPQNMVLEGSSQSQTGWGHSWGDPTPLPSLTLDCR